MIDLRRGSGRQADKPLPPTPVQLCALNVIRELTELNGCPPTYDVIRTEMDLASKSTVAYLVKELEEKGWIVAPPRGHRRRKHGLVLAHEPPPLPEFPVGVTDAGRAYLQEKALG